MAELLRWGRQAHGRALSSLGRRSLSTSYVYAYASKDVENTTLTQSGERAAVPPKNTGRTKDTARGRTRQRQNSTGKKALPQEVAALVGIVLGDDSAVHHASRSRRHGHAPEQSSTRHRVQPGSLAHTQQQQQQQQLLPSHLVPAAAPVQRRTVRVAEDHASGETKNATKLASSEEVAEAIMARRRLRLYNMLREGKLTGAWQHFSWLANNSSLSSVSPVDLSRLLTAIQHTLHHSPTTNAASKHRRQGSSAEMVHSVEKNTWLHELFSAMYEQNAEFAHARDYATWINWLLRRLWTPRATSRATASSQSSVNAAITVYLRAKALGHASDARLSYAAVNIVRQATHHQADAETQQSEFLSLYKDVLTTPTALHPSAYTLLLKAGQGWAPADVAFQLYETAKTADPTTPRPGWLATWMAGQKHHDNDAPGHDAELLLLHDAALACLSNQRCGDADLAIRVCIAMHTKGLYPLEETWVGAATMLLAQARRHTVLKLWKERCASKRVRNPRVAAPLIQALNAAGCLSLAASVYEEVCQHAEQLRRLQHPKQPNHLAVAGALRRCHRAMLLAYLTDDALIEAEQVLGHWQNTRDQSDVGQNALAEAYARVIHVYGRHDCMEDVERVLKDAEQRLGAQAAAAQPVTAMLRAWLHTGRGKDVVAWWYRQKQLAKEDSAAPGIFDVGNSPSDLASRCAVLLEALIINDLPEEAESAFVMFERTPVGQLTSTHPAIKLWRASLPGASGDITTPHSRDTSGHDNAEAVAFPALTKDATKDSSTDTAISSDWEALLQTIDEALSHSDPTAVTEDDDSAAPTVNVEQKHNDPSSSQSQQAPLRVRFGKRRGRRSVPHQEQPVTRPDETYKH
ncbi:hypothetical protein THASP1DRAFT_27147 [Thamnocephalis sphaerospora]|uniref:Uncharacterized protein n=1 Tax=Thamnocephalis sphaerospora TaxID=78915 RepID=A0A4P9XXE8_9FUNG|nr:hypothetical protein THASP1DRAFT_27147 [Thamnocephalis sphaerospora]|eukprot:RKP11048.1 hypothetical protein THASP1DRAFT_27147 [Thamnocephalis sphaerospora]